LAQFHFQVIAEKSYFLVGLICQEDCPVAHMLKVKFLINLFGKIMPSLKQIFLPFFFFFFWEKYNLAPQTTIDSPDGTPNYQSLDSGHPNYLMLVFWPHPSAWAV
jgi:hypothetical protein